VFGGRVEVLGLGDGEVVCASECGGVGEPDGVVAVVAAAGLCVVGELSKAASFFVHRMLQEVHGAPYHPDWVSEGEFDGMGIREPQISAGAGQQCRREGLYRGLDVSDKSLRCGTTR
jgi:hypothetical protein